MSNRQQAADLPKKPECVACGADDYIGELRTCPDCGGDKCSVCDMGNDVGCARCEAEEKE